MRNFVHKKYVKIPICFLVIFSLAFQFLLFLPKEVRAYSYPRVCQPRIPFYDRALTTSELTTACYFFKDLQNSAQHLARTARKVEEYTDPLNKCNPAFNCYADCSLKMPNFKCFVDIVCMIPGINVICSAGVLKAISDILQTGSDIFQVFKTISHVATFGSDLVELGKTSVGIVSNLQKLVNLFGEIDVEEIKKFFTNFMKFEMAKAETQDRIEEIKGRIVELANQVKAYLANKEQKFISKDLRTNLEKIRRMVQVEKTIDEELSTEEFMKEKELVNEFYQKFKEMESSVYKLDNLIAQPELSDLIEEVELGLNPLMLAVGELNDISEDFLEENALVYLGKIEVPLFKARDNLLGNQEKNINGFVPKFENFRTEFHRLIRQPKDTASEEIKSFYQSLVAEIEIISQNIAFVRPIVVAVAEEIKRLETLTGKDTIEELANETIKKVEDVERIILEQLYGKVKGGTLEEIIEKEKERPERRRTGPQEERRRRRGEEEKEEREREPIEEEIPPIWDNFAYIAGNVEDPKNPGEWLKGAGAWRAIMEGAIENILRVFPSGFPQLESQAKDIQKLISEINSPLSSILSVVGQLLNEIEGAKVNGEIEAEKFPISTGKLLNYLAQLKTSVFDVSEKLADLEKQFSKFKKGIINNNLYYDPIKRELDIIEEGIDNIRPWI
ncbi:MAG: hypothetical protein QMC93_00335 [Patescibacteria group bacterium]|nr:hypothetical protein [Patescibacteria group bacterium]